MVKRKEFVGVKLSMRERTALQRTAMRRRITLSELIRERVLLDQEPEEDDVASPVQDAIAAIRDLLFSGVGEQDLAVETKLIDLEADLERLQEKKGKRADDADDEDDDEGDEEDDA